MARIDLFKYALGSLMHRQMRSKLTVLGIVIGIVAIVTIVSIGTGLNEYLQGQLQSFGNDLIRIAPGSPRSNVPAPLAGGAFGASANLLTLADADVVQRTAGVAEVHPMLSGRLQIDYRGEKATSSVMGVGPGLFDSFSSIITVRDGRVLRAGDSHVVVIGSHIADGTFDKNVTLGRTLTIANQSFRVVGILEKSSMSLFDTQDMVILPFNDARTLMSGTKAPNQVDFMLAKVAQGEDVDAVGASVVERLRNSRHVTEDTQDFVALTPTDVAGRINSITGVLSLFLGGIAAIALVVGGIGIANTMFMSVLERTREIGILKAMGASEKDILELFLIESGLLGLGGGALGVAIGVVVSTAMNYFGVPSVVTWEVVVGALAFSVGVGLVFGVVPARNAARLEPVEALRYE